MYKNLVKARLRNKEPVLGCIIQGALPALVEIIGLSGFHFVFLDTEHYSMSFSDCENMILAAEARGVVPFVRPPENNPKTILRFLDIGAMGIVVPEINNCAEAEAAVRAVKYAPLGERGLASTRALDYGFGKGKSEALQQANEETMVVAVIESREGVENAAEIMAVPGIDSVFIGTSDLSMSYGVPGQTNHPLVQEAFEKVLSVGQEMNVPIGAIVRDGESPKRHFERGLSLAFTSVYSILKAGAKNFVREGLEG